MNNDWIIKAILKLLSGLKTQEAQKILSQAKQSLAVQVPEKNGSLKISPNTFRVVGRSKINQDPELKKFILDLPYMTLASISNVCETKFGIERTPSKSSLHRFLQSQKVVK